jgi:CIC family chloride channel protein
MNNSAKRSWAAPFLRAFDYLRLGENTSIVIISTFIGILGGFGAIGFRMLIGGLQNLAIQKSGTNILERLAELHWFHLLFLPAIGGLVVGLLVYFFAREAKGHGVPEVMEAVALRGGRIRPRVIGVKALASAVCISTGGSIGREGPIVQIGSAIGSMVGQRLRMSQEKMRVLVGCGAAAGIAATFNAPVAGVLFAIEIILGSYAITTLTPLILSSVIATVICHAFPAITGGNVRAFSIPFKYSLVSAWEIPFFFILGAVAAFVSLAFIFGTYRMEDLFNRLKLPDPFKTMIGGLCLGALFVAMPFVSGYAHCYGIGYQTIEMVLEGEIIWYVLLLLVFFKLFATTVTLGSGGSGGIFAPSLFLGAVMGGAFGFGLESFFPASIPVKSGAYALVGMGAVVAGTTHAPITAILIIFELTGDYQIMLPLMISCVISTLIASRLKRDSIYTEKLSRRGVNLHLGLEAKIMESTLVRDLMQTDVAVIAITASFQDVLSRMLDEHIQELFVTDETGALKGIITLNEVKTVINEADLEQVIIAADLMETAYKFVTPDTTVLACMNKFGASDTGELPVVRDAKSRKLVGVITRRSIFLLYNREVLRQGTLGLKYVSGAGGEERKDFIEIAEDHTVSVLPVTEGMNGRSLRELDLRARYNVNVVSIKGRRFEYRRPDSDVPDPDQHLRRSDSLVVVGPKVAIERMKEEL